MSRTIKIPGVGPIQIHSDTHLDINMGEGEAIEIWHREAGSSPPAHNASILMETGSYALMETGDTILLEA
jgi:hypothetical protein